MDMDAVWQARSSHDGQGHELGFESELFYRPDIKTLFITWLPPVDEPDGVADMLAYSFDQKQIDGLIRALISTSHGESACYARVRGRKVTNRSLEARIAALEAEMARLKTLPVINYSGIMQEGE